jgi:ribosomal protein S11
MAKRNNKSSTKFFFGLTKHRHVRIYLRKSFTNIFFTVTDLRNRVIYTLSGGMCSEKNNRRSKVIPFIVEAMSKKIIKVFRTLHISLVQLILKTSLRAHLRILVYRLSKANFKISSILDRRIAAHNGVRARSLKRR